MSLELRIILPFLISAFAGFHSIDLSAIQKPVGFFPSNVFKPLELENSTIRFCLRTSMFFTIGPSDEITFPKVLLAASSQYR